MVEGVAWVEFMTTSKHFVTPPVPTSKKRSTDGLFSSRHALGQSLCLKTYHSLYTSSLFFSVGFDLTSSLPAAVPALVPDSAVGVALSVASLSASGFVLSSFLGAGVSAMILLASSIVRSLWTVSLVVTSSGF